SDFAGCQGEGGAMERRIQPTKTAQQFGISDAARVCGARSPFAFLNDPAAGAQPVKAEMHSLRSALTAFRPGRERSERKAKGPSQRLFLNRASLVMIGRKNGGRSPEQTPKTQRPSGTVDASSDQ